MPSGGEDPRVPEVDARHLERRLLRSERRFGLHFLRIQHHQLVLGGAHLGPRLLQLRGERRAARQSSSALAGLGR